MHKPTISMIAAVSSHDRSIGKNNELLWEIPEDLQYFRDTTKGKPVIMGRATFESIIGYIGKPLPGRQNIIVTLDKSFTYDGVDVVHSMEDAIEIASKDSPDEIFIIGGGQIYALGLPLTDRLYITIVETDIPGDTFFPEYEHKFTKIVSERKSSDDNFEYTFKVLDRK